MGAIVMYTDGAARGNPGPAAIGAAIFERGELIGEVSEYVGTRTNNWAEYQAVIAGLTKVKQLGKRHEAITCYLDSKLVAEQLSGRWQIKEETLFGQYIAVHNMLVTDFNAVAFEHVPREKNKHADALANQALDART